MERKQNQPKNSLFQQIRCEYWVGFNILAGFDAGFDISPGFDINHYRYNWVNLHFSNPANTRTKIVGFSYKNTTG